MLGLAGEKKNLYQIYKGLFLPVEVQLGQFEELVPQFNTVIPILGANHLHTAAQLGCSLLPLPWNTHTEKGCYMFLEFIHAYSVRFLNVARLPLFVYNAFHDHVWN